jgi:hypothetical protein
MLLETKIRILELHRTGRSISSLVREFRVARSTILRVLAARAGLELSARCTEMLAHGVDPYVVADLRRLGVKRLKEFKLTDYCDRGKAKLQ